MQFQNLRPALKGYVLGHFGAMVPLVWLLSRLPAPSDPPLLAVLLTAAAVLGVWRTQLTVVRGHHSPVTIVICLALALQGTTAAVLCSALGVLVTHLVKVDGPWWRLRWVRTSGYRRLFNGTHCALVTALSAWLVAFLGYLPSDGWPAALCAVALFTTAHFLLNSWGVALAIALERDEPVSRIWREHFFWTAPGHFACAGVAYLIWLVYSTTGPAALLLLPCGLLVSRAGQSYVELLRKERELTAQVQELYRREEEANRRKDEFLATLAHELRNPLAAITNAHYLLAQRREGSGAEATEVIGRQAWRLKRLVDDLLDVSRITRGAVELRPEEVDLRRVLQDAVEMVQPLMRERRHLLRVETSETPLVARVDALRIEQVFANLLVNAAKYTPPEGEIAVSLCPVDGEAALEVRDTGIGIDPELLPQIFDLFVQADRSLAQSAGGLGVGLALARGLVEQHGGRVEAASGGVGQGSTFSVRLPLAPPERSALLRVGLEQQGLRMAAGLRSREDVSATPHARQPGRVRILLIEDNVDAAETLTEMLDLWGYDVLVAHSGENGLERALSESPEVVLCDIGLPDLEGYDVARRLRAASGVHMTLIALTGYGRPEDRDTALDAGFDHHVVKPIAPERLRALLQQVLAGRGVPAAC
jgi:two-component system, sensor histidine kinase